MSFHVRAVGAPRFTRAARGVVWLTCEWLVTSRADVTDAGTRADDARRPSTSGQLMQVVSAAVLGLVPSVLGGLGDFVDDGLAEEVPRTRAGYGVSLIIAFHISCAVGRTQATVAWSDRPTFGTV